MSSNSNSKALDLYAAGDALVDIIVRVEDSLLAKFGLRAGEHKLVTAGEQQQILEAVGKENLTVSSGGSEANTVITIKQLGLSSAFSCCVGADNYGGVFQSELEQLGVKSDIKVSKTDPTGLSLILISGSGERTMLTSLGASKHLLSEDIKENLISTAKWALLTAYKFNSQEGLASIDKVVNVAKKNHTKVIFSLASSNIVQDKKARILTSLSSFDLVVGNKEEFSQLYASQEEPIETTLSKIVSNSHLEFVMTAGADGSFFFSSTRTVHVPAVQIVRPCDLTGAGDVFLAGFLHSYISDGSATEALNSGNYLASKVIQQIGARI